MDEYNQSLCDEWGQHASYEKHEIGYNPHKPRFEINSSDRRVNLIKIQQEVSQTRSGKLVYGYINNIRKLLPTISIIPMMIQYMILMYYYFSDYFNFQPYEYLKVTEDNLCITNTKNCLIGHYLISTNLQIESMCNQQILWELDIFYATNLTVGICQNNKNFISEQNFYYKLCSYAYQMSKDDKGKNQALKFDTASSITIYLNLKNQEMLLKIDDMPPQIGFTNIKTSTDISYSFYIELPNKGDSVTLTNFEIK